MVRPIVLLFILAFSQGLPAQDRQVTVLEKKIREEKNDTTRIRLIRELDELIYSENSFYSDSLAASVRDLCKETLKDGQLKNSQANYFKEQLSWAYFTLAFNAKERGELVKAWDNYHLALQIDEELEDWLDIGKIYGNLATIFELMGDNTSAVDYYLKAITLYDKFNNQEGLAIQYSNLGQIYQNIENYPKAFYYYNKALAIDRDLKDSVGMSIDYSNFGGWYYNQKKLDSALYYHQLSLELKNQLALISELSVPYTNIGLIHMDRGEWTEALRYFELSLDQDQKNNDKIGMGISYDNLSTFYFLTGNYSLSRKYALLQQELTISSGYMKGLAESYYNLFRADSAMGNSLAALKNFQTYVSYKDSIDNQDVRQDILEQGMRFEFDRRMLADSIQNANEREIVEAHLAEKEAQLKSSRLQKLFLGLGALVVIVFAFFMYSRYKVTKKQNQIIEEKSREVETQKEIIEEKHKEITDSINYALRLQKALLAPKDEIDKAFPENFLFYQPKDIVAGDFYFFEETDDFIFLAAADCTGHGVPGAMVSVVCSNALSRCVKEFKLSDPAAILDKTRELVVSTFEKNADDVKDGMDISLVTLHKKNKEVRWAGANNPLWVVSNGVLKEYKADKQAIGKSDRTTPFTSHLIPVSEEHPSCFYLFTDGFADQFGGPKGKKFKYSNFAKHLVEISSHTMDSQGELLKTSFDSWKGELEQLDDVLVMGLRI